MACHTPRWAKAMVNSQPISQKMPEPESMCRHPAVEFVMIAPSGI
jgi:hypothetical protein